ncbi:CobW family GTP-binding protein [Antricoccus suffuscus]|nr:GTP-binding protein [Antricoccus suffuscus]
MTVVGGYLGAGKTTLINSLLASAEGVRIAVIVNDFGDINIDADLIKSRDAKTLELSNGCICCDLSDGMASVMDQIRALRPAPDHVVVEVSGVGDPAAVARWADHPGFRRNGVVVCADVTDVRRRAEGRWSADTVRGQLRAGDVLLLTKQEVASEGEARLVRAWLREVAPGVPVLDGSLETIGTLLDPLLRRGSDERTEHADHVRWSGTTGRTVELTKLRTILTRMPERVVRAKGIVRSVDDPLRRTIVQLAGARVDCYDDGEWQDGEVSRLAVIAIGDEPIDQVIPAGLRALFTS